MIVPEPLVDRIAASSEGMTPAQTRVARLVTEAPSVIAFGTVAEVAAEADTSPQTVLRLAARLGHDGFAGLQEEVRADLVERLPPAATRIRQRPGSDLLGEVVAADEHNVAASLDVDRASTDAAIELLADLDRGVFVVAADSWTGVGQVLAGQLSQLRDGVVLVDGAPTRVARALSGVRPGDLVVALDVRRYERWVVAAVDQGRAAGAQLVAVTDAVTSPLFARADHAFVVGVASPGPFESLTGVVSLLHLLITSVAARLRDHARDRLDAAERAWTVQGALVD